jgi:hypothetical protein
MDRVLCYISMRIVNILIMALLSVSVDSCSFLLFLLPPVIEGEGGIIRS